MLSVSETSLYLESHAILAIVIASASEATNEHRIPRKSARKAMAKPQHSRALDSAIFDSLLLINYRIPNHSAHVYVLILT